MGRRAEVEAADPGAVSPLVDAARRGEAWALTEIWQRHAPSVTGYLRGRGASEPQDLTSDVSPAVLERLRSFRGGEAALRAFVSTVAHHRLVDALRRRSRRGPTIEYDAATDGRRSDSAEDEALDALHTQRVHALL